MDSDTLNLISWIKETGLTVEYLACKLNVDRSYIYKLMNGTRNPSKKLMKKITKSTLGKITEQKELLNG